MRRSEDDLGMKHGLFSSQAHSSHDLLTLNSRDIYSQFVTWSLPRVFIVTTISVLDKIKMILAAIMCMCNEMIPDPSLGNGGHTYFYSSCSSFDTFIPIIDIFVKNQHQLFGILLKPWFFAVICQRDLALRNLRVGFHETK